jgi:transglutaminase-like putative cysteine protease
MRFNIRAHLAYRAHEPCEVLLLVEAARRADQTVLSEQLTITPHGDLVRIDDDITGERRVVFTAQSQFDIAYTAQVEVTPDVIGLKGLPAMAIRDLPGEALRYLRPSRYCPSDRFEAFVHRQFAQYAGGDKVAAISDWVAGHLDYRAGVSHSGTTALDTFVDRAGVCRDFSHLTISLCRAADIPARAVSAYAWNLQPPDLHAVAEVYVGGRWHLVDSTCMAPVDGLVRVATGADAADVAFMTLFGTGEMLAQTFDIQAAS